MEKEYEQKYVEFQEKNFWFLARRELILYFIKKIKRKNTKILEIGSGSGANITEIKKKFPDIYVKGIEYSKEIVKIAKRKKNNVVFGNITNIKEKNESYDLILCLDVLEHVEDDKKAIQEIRRVLKKDGRAIISVPVFRSLWGEQDIVNKHVRRYSKKGLLRKLKGFKIGRITYWNSLLFFPVLLLRTMQRTNDGKRKKKAESDFEKTGRFNKMLLSLLRVDNWIIKNKINLPLGISLFAIVEKTENES